MPSSGIGTRYPEDRQQRAGSPEPGALAGGRPRVALEGALPTSTFPQGLQMPCGSPCACPSSSQPCLGTTCPEGPELHPPCQQHCQQHHKTVTAPASRSIFLQSSGFPFPLQLWAARAATTLWACLTLVPSAGAHAPKHQALRWRA